MIIRDCNGLIREVEDGQAMTIFNGTVSVDGHVMIVKDNAWLKVRRGRGIEFLLFGHHSFVPIGAQRQGSTYLPHASWQDSLVEYKTPWMNNPRNTPPKWEVGSYYRHRTFHERGFMELIYEEGAWVTFRRLDMDGNLKYVMTSRKSEKPHLEKVNPPFKSYDPKQQPYDDGDI